MANPNDEIRDKILRHLYEVHRRARGPKGVASGIRDLHSVLKNEGIKQADLIANLDYLVQKGWAREIVEQRTFRTKGGTTQVSERRAYKISDIGIDKLEGASVYRREESFSRINVTNVRGVTVIGTGNIVNTQLTDLSTAVTALEREVAESPNLSNEQKLDALADLATIQSQLSKPKPNGNLIRTVWGGTEKIVTVAGLIEAAVKVSELIRSLP